MLKDTGIPPYAILRKNVCEGARVSGQKITEIITPPWG